MMHASPLTQLHDIVEQQSASWLPLAWGWWVIIALLLLTIVYLLLKLKRHRMARITQIQCIASVRSALNVESISQALRIAIRHYHRNAPELERATGVELFIAMNQHLPTTQRLPERDVSEIGKNIYSTQSADYLERYRHFALLWLEKSLPPKQQQIRGPR